MGTVAGKSHHHNRQQGFVGTYSRTAYHAGSWYSDSPFELAEQLGSLMNAAERETTANENPLRGIICPHAGYSYSGPTAAFSYHHLMKELAKKDSPITQILILHPSHHVYLDGCAVSGATKLETPLGDLMVDSMLRDEILSLRSSVHATFNVMTKSMDEHEHSGEMQYPYIAKALDETNRLSSIKVLPVMCGSISLSQEEEYGKLLAPIVGRPNVLCVVSTDFCHWGSRFRYQPDPGTTSTMEIHAYIRELDHEGMKHIEMEEPGAFAKYLKKTRNTICGRHAVGVWLNAVHFNNPDVESLEIAFIRYAQSSAVRSMRESSVSYASATARRNP